MALPPAPIPRPPGRVPSIHTAAEANGPYSLSRSKVPDPRNNTTLAPWQDHEDNSKANKAAAAQIKENTKANINSDGQKGKKRKAQDECDKSVSQSLKKRKVQDKDNRHASQQLKKLRKKTYNSPPHVATGLAASNLTAAQIQQGFHFANSASMIMVPNGQGAFIPLQNSAMKWDPKLEGFVPTGLVSQGRPTLQPIKPGSKKGSAFNNKTPSANNKANNGPATKTRPKRKTIHEYDLRKRQTPEPAPIGEIADEDAGTSSKRARLENNNLEDGEIAESTNTPQHEIVKEVIKKKKQKKHHRHPTKKIKDATLHNTDPDLLVKADTLFPHYKPTSPSASAIAATAARNAPQETNKSSSTTLMDLPSEVRRIIWDKVFEDESYTFKIKKSCDRSKTSDMRPIYPKSFGCLFINKVCSEEVSQQMYKSMRLELEFGRLRPHATREFMAAIAKHWLAQRCWRIFFVKKFGLQRVNFGVFREAREIVSTHWTVSGDGEMDEDDYKDDRLDPRFVLNRPPTRDKLKGLKERRYWRDQEAAAQRCSRHVEGWCHPDGKDPKAGGFDAATDKVHECPWGGACEALKGTVFVMVVKYKYRCVRGRHARHKEAFFDFYPNREGPEEREGEGVRDGWAHPQLEMVGGPRRKFHKKCNKRVDSSGELRMFGRGRERDWRDVRLGLKGSVPEFGGDSGGEMCRSCFGGESEHCCE